MKIAKEYRWEMGHRLQHHEGVCKNLHGHSYKLVVELDGKPGKNGMLIDFYDLDKMVNPLLAEFDHGFFAVKSDTKLLEALEKLNSKMIVKDFEPTAENISKYFLDKLSEGNFSDNIKNIIIRVYESEDSFAEASRGIN